MSEEIKHVYEFSTSGRAYIRAASSEEAKQMLNKLFQRLSKENPNIISYLTAVQETGGPG